MQVKEKIVRIPRLYALQEKILQKASKYRFKILMCGRRFGKTRLISYIIMNVLRGKVVYLMAPEFASVAELWDEITKIIGHVAVHIDNNLRIMNFAAPEGAERGGLFRVIGLHSKIQQDKGRGPAVDIAIYEETQSIDSNILKYHWENVMRWTLADRMGEAWFIGTPPNSKAHYFAKLFCRGAVNNPNAMGPDVPMEMHVDMSENEEDKNNKNYISFRKTARDNPYISNAELDDIKRDHPRLVYMQEFEAKFVEYTNRPFIIAFEEEAIKERVFSRKVAPDLSLPFYISFDFNLAVMAATIWQKNADNTYIACLAEFGYKAGEKGSIHNTLKLIREWFLKNTGYRFGAWDSDLNAPIIPAPHELRIFITGDATGNQGNGYVAKGLTFYQIIEQDLGLKNRQRQNPSPFQFLPAANPHHSNTFDQMNLWLYRHKNIYIHPHCIRLAQDMALAEVNDDKSINKEKYDPHFLDTARYFFNSFLPALPPAMPMAA